MSATKERLPYAEALALAEEVKGIISHYCERIEIAGSIRRRADRCGDIEIVCIPKRTVTDLFGEPTADHDAYVALGELANNDPAFDYRLNKLGAKSFGRQMMLLTYKGFALDVFVTSPEQWAVTMLIRTGPAEYSHRFAMRKSEGGYLGCGQVLKGWRILQLGVALDTPDEESIYEQTGNAYVEPWERRA